MASIGEIAESTGLKDYFFHSSFEKDLFELNNGGLFFHSFWSGPSEICLRGIFTQIASHSDLPSDFEFHVFDSPNAEELYQSLFDRDFFIGAGETIWFRDSMKMGVTMIGDLASVAPLQRLWPCGT